MSAEGRTVAVTGALGFVAAHLIPRLHAGGARVTAIVRPGRDAAPVEAMGCAVRRADLEQPPLALFEGMDSIVHLAGIAQAAGLVPALEAAHPRRAVFVGSAGVYTRLASTGAEAKRVGERALRASAIDYTILRPSMIYGTPRDRNLVRLLRWIDHRPLVPLPAGGRTLQQPVHVDDLCSAILAALDRPAAARAEYDVGGPEPLPLAEIVRHAALALGRPARVVPVPLGPAHGLAVLCRSLGLPFPVRPEQVLRLEESKAVDIGPARRDLGFDPRPFADGIAEEVRMLREIHPGGGRRI
jgi:nucleoside-diphosphate-sugar epimerase